MSVFHRIVRFRWEDVFFSVAIRETIRIGGRGAKIYVVSIMLIRIIRMIVMNSTKPTPRNRTIRWDESIDKLAADLAFEKRMKGGVSELLARLIKAESKRKRGIAHLHSAV
jgi:hypothetical protein